MAQRKAKKGVVEQALRQLAARLRRGKAGAPGGQAPEQLHLGPASAFEALLQERISTLERSVEEVKGRVNGLIFLVVGAVLAQLLLGLLT